MRPPKQRPLPLPEAEPLADEPGYLSGQLITYLGNKRSLLGPIRTAVETVQRRLGRTRLRCFDAFSGSGVVSRLLKPHASLLISNDLEQYAAAIGRCYLTNRSSVDFRELGWIVEDLNARVLTAGLPPGFIEELYAPADEHAITADDRVFYTQENARRLDNYRRLIDTAPPHFRDLLLGPLLSRASVHANTAGVFKGFYKNRHTKRGQFGGSGADALTRILGRIVLEPPILSRYECDCRVMCDDANTVAQGLADLDLTYLDPPYNQHPYGSNYFMLNLLVEYQRPQDISRVSGIPKSWRRSGYNVRADAQALLTNLIETLDSRFLLISLNNEGFIKPAALEEILQRVGPVEKFELPYNAFRGSRSFQKRSIHVTEHLFLVEKR